MPNGNTAGAERQYRAMDGAVPNRDTEGANRRDYSLVLWDRTELVNQSKRKDLAVNPDIVVVR